MEAEPDVVDGQVDGQVDGGPQAIEAVEAVDAIDDNEIFGTGVTGTEVLDDATEPVAVTIDLGFEEQFDRLYVRAYGVAYQLLGRRSEAEDVAQETLARCFVRWRKVRDYAEAWVVRVAGNLAIDTWRRDRRRADRVDDAAAAMATQGPDPQRVDLHRALGKLSRRQRDVLVLRFLADLPEADTARALGCSVGSVKQHASRGLAALRATAGLVFVEEA